ncbi:MAG: acyl-CoA dehydrogenase family protein [SAR324 cluster bacterium]|nr:acyl-CoA dehydrogenase family protein [SAR324 cluster bacterium]|tara:strand:- start:349 stop:1545 length:1197 start_codon:yes stop_codon:yes gene_type:complete
MFELTETQKQLQATAREFAKKEIAPRAAEVDRTEQYPWENVKQLTKQGFMGMTVPQEYGGPGMTYLDVVLVIEEIAKVCGVSARIVVEANMGAVGAVMKYGSETQKKLAAEHVLSGDKPAICITEPGAGSAASEMSTRADHKGDHYILNGTKHWITGGGVSKFHLIFARVFENEEPQGIAGFIALSGTDGLKVGTREPAMGLRGIPETQIICEDLEVPEEMILIPPEGLQRGFAGLMNAYNGQRVGAGTVALGIAAGAYELALEYSQQREQFGRPICEFQGLQWMLADMHTQLEAARLLLRKAACSGKKGFPDMLEAAQAKIFASEMAIKVTNDALQIFGSAGYSRNLPLERMARDARMFTIGGGTAQILRTVVASALLDRKLPQTRDGHFKLAEKGV